MGLSLVLGCKSYTTFLYPNPPAIKQATLRVGKLQALPPDSACLVRRLRMLTAFMLFSADNRANYKNAPSSLIDSLSTRLMYCPCITLLSHFFFKDHLNLSFVNYTLPFWVIALICLVYSSATITAILIDKFIFSLLLSWPLTIFTNWSSVYFVFMYSAILIISALRAHFSLQ